MAKILPWATLVQSFEDMLPNLPNDMVQEIYNTAANELDQQTIYFDDGDIDDPMGRWMLKGKTVNYCIVRVPGRPETFAAEEGITVKEAIDDSELRRKGDEIRYQTEPAKRYDGKGSPWTKLDEETAAHTKVVEDSYIFLIRPVKA